MKLLFIFCLSLSLGIGFIDAQSAEEWYQKGVDAHSYSQKIAHFTKAIQSKADFVEAYNARANVHFAMGKVHEAIQDFSQSIRIDSSRVFTFYSRASCQLALNDYKAAAEDFDKVIELQPNHVYAMSGKGCALMLQGQNETAISILEAALALDASVQSAVKCRTQAMKNMGKPIPITVANKSENTPAIIAKATEPVEVEVGTKYKVKEATGMREAPTHTSRTLLRFEAGNQVELLEKTDEFWWKVRYKGKMGYAKAALLEALN